MASYYGPGSTGATPPPGYGGGQFYSAPTAQEYDRNSLPYQLTPYGPIPYGGQAGRMPGQTPIQDAQGNLVGQGLDRLSMSGQQFQAGAQNPYGMIGTQPGTGVGSGFGGPAGSGAVGPGQLGGLLGPNATDEDRRAMQAMGLSFQEYERLPALYEGGMAGDIRSALQRQISGEDTAFTPDVIGNMHARAGSAASAGHRARSQQIRDQAGGRGLGGGAMELGLRLGSQEAAAQQRAQQTSLFDMQIPQAQFNERVQAQGQGMNLLGQQAQAMTPSILAKGQALGRFEQFGQDPNLFGSGSGGIPGSGPGYNPQTGGFSISSRGGGMGPQMTGGSSQAPGMLGDPWGNGLYGGQAPGGQQQQQLTPMQQLAAMMGMGAVSAPQQSAPGGTPYGATDAYGQRTSMDPNLVGWRNQPTSWRR